VNVLKLKGESTKVGSCDKVSSYWVLGALNDSPRGAITSAVAIVRK